MSELAYVDLNYLIYEICEGDREQAAGVLAELKSEFFRLSRNLNVNAELLAQEELHKLSGACKIIGLEHLGESVEKLEKLSAPLSNKEFALMVENLVQIVLSYHDQLVD